MSQGPGLDGQIKHFEKPWASTALMFIAMALCLPAAALVRRMRSWLRRMDVAAAGSGLHEPLLAQRSASSVASSTASSMAFGWATPPALQAAAPGLPSRQALLLVLVPTAFDLICSWLLNVGLLSITASGVLLHGGAGFAAQQSRAWACRQWAHRSLPNASSCGCRPARLLRWPQNDASHNGPAPLLLLRHSLHDAARL